MMANFRKMILHHFFILVAAAVTKKAINRVVELVGGRGEKVADA